MTAAAHRTRAPWAIEGIGCVTTLGAHPAQVGAALRGRLSRPAELEGSTVLDEDVQEPAPRVGHPIPWLTDGFGPLGRRVVLARAAVESLLSTTRIDA